MKVIFIWVLVALFLVAVNGIYLSCQVEDFASVVSGNSIKEIASGFYETSSLNHRVFILFQFLLLIIVVFMVIKKLKSKTHLSKSDFIGKGGAKYKTDLDTLYEILKRKGEIAVDEIGKVFGVSPEIALEWSRVLENGDLATIDYPRFGKPVLTLLETNRGNNPVAETAIENKKDVKNETAKEKVQVKSASGVVAVKRVGMTDKKTKKIYKKIKKSSKRVSKHSKKLEKKSKKKKR
ncbi:MAG: hypothetical protein ABIF18_02160 [archaeon]